MQSAGCWLHGFGHHKYITGQIQYKDYSTRTVGFIMQVDKKPCFLKWAGSRAPSSPSVQYSTHFSGTESCSWPGNIAASVWWSTAATSTSGGYCTMGGTVPQTFEVYPASTGNTQRWTTSIFIRKLVSCLNLSKQMALMDLQCCILIANARLKTFHF